VTFNGAGHFTGTQTVSSTPMQGVPSPGPRPATGEKANPVQITCTYKLTGTYEVSADGGYTSSFSTRGVIGASTVQRVGGTPPLGIIWLK
jgi:hypothetical protein